MAEPYARPELGSRPHLYRLTRDTMYHTSGTILCLTEDQVTGDLHERVRVESDDTARVDELAARNQSLTDAVMALTTRIHDLEVAHTEPIISVDQPPGIDIHGNTFTSTSTSAEPTAAGISTSIPEAAPDAPKPD